MRSPFTRPWFTFGSPLCPVGSLLASRGFTINFLLFLFFGLTLTERVLQNVIQFLYRVASKLRYDLLELCFLSQQTLLEFASKCMRLLTAFSILRDYVVRFFCVWGKVPESHLEIVVPHTNRLASISRRQR